MRELPVKSEDGKPTSGNHPVVEQSTSTDSADVSVDKTAKSRRFAKRIGLIVLGTILVGSIVVYWNWPSPVVDVELRKQRIAESKGAVEVDPATARDKALAEKLIGTWFQVEYGTKTLTILPDGKAKMVMIPNAFIALTFGPRIDADMYWTVKDGHIDYGINGGTPADKLELAKNSFGDFWHEKIITLTDKSLLLIEEDDDESRWKRLPDEPASSSESSELPLSDS